MDVTAAVKERRSIRRFRPDRVDQNLVRQILEEARWAPSWGNTQTWEFYVVMGEVLEKFKELNRAKLLSGEKSLTDVSMPEVWPERPNRRYVAIAKQLLDALSISRENKNARNQLYAEMYHLFNAPCLIVSCVDKRLALEYAMFDLGLIMQTICLLAHARGLGTCIMASAVMYPGLLRELLHIPEEKRIVVGTALGYPDPGSPANKFGRQRATVDELVTWVG